MTTKIRVKIGDVEVEYEGPEDFLDSKLHRLVDDLSTLAKREPVEEKGSDQDEISSSGTSTLAAFLREKKAESHTDRFLATAQWLHQRGMKRIKTSDVSKALRENNQKKLTNPSVCLNRNVSKGLCEREGKEFFVTDDGRNSLG